MTAVAPPRPVVADQDSAARLHIFASVVFAALSGVLLALAYLSLRYPDAFGAAAQIGYGRLRPVAINCAVFGWLTLANIGAVYYLLPRLTGASLWGERIARLNLAVSVPVYAAAILSPAFGLSSGAGLLEFPWYLDILVLATLAVPLLVAVQTLRRRTEEGLYVSLWYAAGGLLSAVVLFLVGNIPGLGGITSALQQAVFGSGYLWLWVVGAGIGAAYYILPKETGNPLFSRGLASAGFWSLMLAAVWAGPAALTFAPTPPWAQTVSTVLALAMAVPALAVAVNFAGTLHGRWDAFNSSLAVRFVVAATAVYLLLAVAAAGQGFPAVASILGFTPSADAVLVVGVFGLGGLLAAAFTYHALPRVSGRAVFSPHTGRLHLRLVVLGVVALGVLLWVVGTVSGYGWIGSALSGAFVPVGEGFLETQGSVLGFLTLLPLAALLIALGQLAFAYNVYRTYTSGDLVPQEVLVAAPVVDGETSDE